MLHQCSSPNRPTTRTFVRHAASGTLTDGRASPRPSYGQAAPRPDCEGVRVPWCLRCACRRSVVFGVEGFPTLCHDFRQTARLRGRSYALVFAMRSQTGGLRHDRPTAKQLLSPTSRTFVRHVVSNALFVGRPCLASRAFRCSVIASAKPPDFEDVRTPWCWRYADRRAGFATTVLRPCTAELTASVDSRLGSTGRTTRRLRGPAVRLSGDSWQCNEPWPGNAPRHG